VRAFGPSFLWEGTVLDKTQVISMETRRLTEKYGKEYLDCKDLMQVLGVGRDNARQLIRSQGFPVTTLGNRKVVSVLAFVIWQMTS
jgi:hypothetical protein